MTNFYLKTLRNLKAWWGICLQDVVGIWCLKWTIKHRVDYQGEKLAVLSFFLLRLFAREVEGRAISSI